MKIIDIYKKYFVPPNLQEHLLTVTKLALHIGNNFKQPINLDLLKTVSLLHDIGNIVKFDLEKFPHFLGNEIENIDYWKNKQQEITKKYGNDDHLVTEKILHELNIDSSLIKVILDKSFSNSVKISQSNNWLLKILSYADMRVLPNGICSLQQRLDDVKNRMDKYKDRPDLPELINACYEIEKQIQNETNINLDTINQESVNKDHFDYLNFEI